MINTTYNPPGLVKVLTNDVPNDPSEILPCRVAAAGGRVSTGGSPRPGGADGGGVCACATAGASTPAKTRLAATAARTDHARFTARSHAGSHGSCAHRPPRCRDPSNPSDRPPVVAARRAHTPREGDWRTLCELQGRVTSPRPARAILPGP